MRLAGLHVFLLNDPEDIERVLVTDHERFEKGRSLAGARPLFGNGLLTSDGELHARQRKLVQPLFQHDRLGGYAATMAALAAALRDRLRDGEETDVAKEMSGLTLAIAGRSLFGRDGDALAAGADEVLTGALDALDVALLPFAPVIDRLPLPQFQRPRHARARLDRMLDDLIERRRASGETEDDLLSVLLAGQEDGISDDQVRDEMVTLLLAGHDTTGNALAWAWHLLAQHRDVEARLHAELDAAIGDRLPVADDMPALPLTRAVFAEAMRLYPPAWILARVPMTDYRLRGFTLPAGSIVVMSPWVVHRSEVYFPDPSRFDPDRWAVARRNGRPRFAYFPFGGGPRGCMGEAFAWMEGILVIATIAQHWRFETTRGRVEPWPLMTLKPKDGLLMRALRRRSA